MRWKRVIGTIVVIALGLAVVASAVLVGFFHLSLKPKLEGPRVPICALPTPPRADVWSRPFQLTNAVTPGSRVYDVEPHAAVMTDGTLAVIFNPRDKIYWRRSGISFARIDPDEKATISPYPTDRAEGFDAWMARDPHGLLHAVWLAHDGGSPEKNMNVAYATSPDGITWTTPPRQVHAPADYDPGQRGGLDKPMVVVTSDGVVHVFYFSEKAESLVTTHGPEFAERTKVPGDAYGSVQVGANDALHVVTLGEEAEGASRFGDAKNSVKYTFSTDRGASWRPGVRVNAVDESVPAYFSNPQVGVDDTRKLVYVAYPSGTPDGKWNLRLAVSGDNGESWRRIVVNDDSPCATHMAPQLVVDPTSGTIHLTWLDHRDGRGFVAYATCVGGAVSCSTNERISESFTRFSLARHLPHWLGEYGALVLDRDRRVLHAIWTQTVQEQGEDVSRIFHAKRSL